MMLIWSPQREISSGLEIHFKTFPRRKELQNTEYPKIACFFTSAIQTCIYHAPDITFGPFRFKFSNSVPIPPQHTPQWPNLVSCYSKFKVWSTISISISIYWELEMQNFRHCPLLNHNLHINRLPRWFTLKLEKHWSNWDSAFLPSSVPGITSNTLKLDQCPDLVIYYY